jgi:hypothetical protein
MIRQTNTAILLTAALASAALLMQSARAGMIPTQVSVTPDGSNFRWTYGVVVTTDVNVNPGDSFTIYDFGSLVSGSIVAPTDWSVSTQNSGPARNGTNPFDDPTIANMTFTYNGTNPIVGQSGLGNFWALSQSNGTDPSQFTSTAHRQIDGRTETNITTTDVPHKVGDPPINGTPEPATLALLGAGLPLVGLARWLRLRRKK